MALSIHQGINTIDEFTSVVDRNTAKSLSWALRKYYNKTKTPEQVFIASCHHDVEEWLLPDYIYDTDLQRFRQKESLCRPKIELRIESTGYETWNYFKKHHYLTTEMSKATHSYVATWNGIMVGFMSLMFRTGTVIYWGGCRLVVLPEFQGLGIGKAISEAIGEEYLKKGHKYYTKTAHRALGEYRNSSPLWRGTSQNMTARTDYIKVDGSVVNSDSKTHKEKESTKIRDAHRVCYCHEFIGDNIQVEVVDNSDLEERY
jgi:GNAT superfamily N-acetyltransferase